MVAQGFSCPVECDLEGFFGQVHGLGSLLVAHALNVAQLECGAHLFGQLVEESVYALQPFVVLHLLLWREGTVGRIGLYGFEREIIVFTLGHAVECQVSADGEAVGFEAVDLLQLVAFAPHAQQRVLCQVLRLLRIERDAKPRAVYSVLQREQVVAEIYHSFGRLSVW